MNPHPGRIEIKAVDRDNFERYTSVGVRSYREHYLHLWEASDASYYFQLSFNPQRLLSELHLDQHYHYIIYLEGEAVGILKLIANRGYPQAESISGLFVEKLYLLNAAAGKGVGRAVMTYAESMAMEMKLTYVWLETMKLGPALEFYKKMNYRIIADKQLGFPGVKEDQREMYILQKIL